MQEDITVVKVQIKLKSIQVIIKVNINLQMFVRYYNSNKQNLSNVLQQFANRISSRILRWTDINLRPH